jgi:hypothetical protein
MAISWSSEISATCRLPVTGLVAQEFIRQSDAAKQPERSNLFISFVFIVRLKKLPGEGGRFSLSIKRLCQRFSSPLKVEGTGSRFAAGMHER